MAILADSLVWYFNIETTSNELQCLWPYSTNFMSRVNDGDSLSVGYELFLRSTCLQFNSVSILCLLPNQDSTSSVCLSSAALDRGAFGLGCCLLHTLIVSWANARILGHKSNQTRLSPADWGSCSNSGPSSGPKWAVTSACLSAATCHLPTANCYLATSYLSRLVFHFSLLPLLLLT